MPWKEWTKSSTGVTWSEINKCAFTFSSEIRQIQCRQIQSNKTNPLDFDASNARGP